MSVRLLIVGGVFGTERTRGSYIVTEVYKECQKRLEEVNLMNGGTLDSLEHVVEHELGQYDAVLWMPDIDNKEDKFLPRIKKNNPEIFLIQSKRCIERAYSDYDLVKRMLSSHAGLCIRIDKTNTYKYTLLDPLGNCWVEKADLYQLCYQLIQRLKHISRMHRMRSVRVGDREPFVLEQDFLDAVYFLGREFDEYVNAVNPNRYLGNASTRCCHGFPSARRQGRYVVSKRNVDKRVISSGQFVEVSPGSEVIHYYGEDKPSVDTPIQIKLYETYPNVNYMVHGHVYIQDAPYTRKCIPCGFLEEVNEIKEVYPDTDASNFVINLKGHGCLIMARDIEYLTKHVFISRDMPEKIL